MSATLTIDIGTTSLKAVLFNEALEVLAEAKQEYATTYPRLGWAEHNPAEWCRATKIVIAELLQKTKVRPAEIVGVGVAGMSSLMLPVDSQGNPLMNGLIWLDRRAVDQSEFISAHHGVEQLSIGGNRSDPSNFGPKAMWLKQQHPDVYEAAACLMHCNSYLVQQMTGTFSMDRTQSGLSQICDIATGEYSDDLLKACSLERSKLPDIFDATAIVGKVDKRGAQAFGLAEGTPVIAGAMDNVAATVGLGLSNAGDAYMAAGTVVNAGVLQDHAKTDGTGLIYHFADSRQWLINGGVDYGGAGLLWFRNLLEDASYEDLCSAAAETPAAELPMLFLPYMAGQRAPNWNADLSGVMLGVSPSSERRHLARSLMESAGLGARHVFKKLCDHMPAFVALTGGITNSPQFTQIFADACGASLRIPPQAETGNLGLAVLVGVGVGRYASVAEGIKHLPAQRVVAPHAQTKTYYADLFDLFCQTYEANLSTLAGLSALRKRYEVTQ
ncbi:xylulokinase [Polycladidibacter hongkongensis]|uniref:xylulokinase n=1 Tax=Polycladidibacter hongkongensis TaxID=1647556 RepID=UPI0008342053|nr:FGGY family carbohydrate kinase [Pseudovibrio hongkongensis]